MKPLISVIVPIYKVEKYLTICVDSLLRQSYGNLEIIPPMWLMSVRQSVTNIRTKTIESK